MKSMRPMEYLLTVLLAGIVCPAALSSPPVKVQPPQSIKLDYLKDIRPILSANCFTCHGQDEKKRQANLRLDVKDSAYAVLASGSRAIIPGKPASSGLYSRIVASGALKMPPEASGKRLTSAEITLLKRWVEQGAPYSAHWAFVKPVRPTVPHLDARSSGWCKTPVDSFIVTDLNKAGITPSAAADRYTLIRRLSLDLIGLPPTLAEIDAFQKDSTPQAYTNLVDRLLASPHFGEKWARPWLDLSRYADSAGYGSDPLRPNLWPYRDWLINALNKNLPYDRFVTDQIAGDLEPNPTQEQLIATAFHRNTMTNTEGGTDREEFRTAAVKDRASTTIQSVMGLTLGCAQCHSHKFDPIKNNEYYRMTAVFNQTADND